MLASGIIDDQFANNSFINDEGGFALSYNYSATLLMDKLQAEEYQLLIQRRNLSQVVEVRRITREDHPCFGQLGLFAVKDLQVSTYIGMYRGYIFVNIDMDTFYLLLFKFYL